MNCGENYLTLWCLQGVKSSIVFWRVCLVCAIYIETMVLLPLALKTWCELRFSFTFSWLVLEAQWKMEDTLILAKEWARLALMQAAINSINLLFCLLHIFPNLLPWGHSVPYLAMYVCMWSPLHTPSSTPQIYDSLRCFADVMSLRWRLMASPAWAPYSFVTILKAASPFIIG